MIRLFVIICIVFIQVLPMHAQNNLQDSCQRLEANEFYTNMHLYSQALIIDSRTPEEFRKERIPGALLAEIKETLFQITDSLDRDQAIYLYCEYEHRSQVACKALEDKGFRNVYYLGGGLEAWKMSGYDIDRKRIRSKKSRD